MDTGSGELTEEQEVVFRSILLAHQQRYPAWQAADIYKLVFQAAMGSEHAAINRRQVEEVLVEELRSMQPGPDEPLVDPISADGRIARVHLRPYLQAGGKWENLLDAFMLTAQQYRGSMDLIEIYSGITVQLCDAGLLKIDPAVVEQYLMKMKKQGFQAVHHSAQYRAAYKPAYRVICREYLGL